MYEIKKLDEKNKPLLEKFCEKAEKAGYENNATIRKMKFGFNNVYDLGVPTHYWAILHDNDIISVSGCHLWSDDGKEYTINRVLFRSATLPEYDNIVKSLNRNHMNSLPFSILLPYQILYGLKNKCDEFRVTTNTGIDALPKMQRTHKVLQLLEKQGLVSFIKEQMFFNKLQYVWSLNLKNYYKALLSFHNTREKLKIGLDKEYYDIIQNGF